MNTQMKVRPSARSEEALTKVLNTHAVNAAFVAPTPMAFGGGMPCASADPELFFPESADDLLAAVALCRECPMRATCLELALARGESGVWGGVLLDEGRAVAGVPARGRPPKAA